MLFQVSLRAVHKEICQKKKKSRDADLTEISFRGQFKLEPHPHCPPLGVSINFPDEQPLHFYMGVLPGITHKYRHINSDDLAAHRSSPRGPRMEY